MTGHAGRPPRPAGFRARRAAIPHPAEARGIREIVHRRPRVWSIFARVSPGTVARRSPRARHVAALLVLAAAALAAPAAAAAPPDPVGWSKQLFKQAEALANQGSFSEACPFFQAAHDLNATGGTALRAADCYEKTASYDRALGMYRYVVEHAGADPVPDRVKLAEGRIAALEKQLRVDPPPPPPSPEAPLSPSPPAPLAPDPPPPSRTPAIVAFAVAGAGAVVAGVTGGLAMAQASSIRQDAATACPMQSCDNPGLDARKHTALAEAWTANVGIGVALVGVVAGVVLLVRASSVKASHRRDVDRVARALGPGGLALRF
jgi:tetratricopeptide (TPR) repeat protein